MASSSQTTATNLVSTGVVAASSVSTTFSEASTSSASSTVSSSHSSSATSTKNGALALSAGTNVNWKLSLFVTMLMALGLVSGI